MPRQKRRDLIMRSDERTRQPIKHQTILKAHLINRHKAESFINDRDAMGERVRGIINHLERGTS